MAGIKRRYKDLNLSLPVNPSSGDLLYLKDEEAIKRALKNLVLTNIYERHFDSSFGTQVIDLLFENTSYFTVASLQSTIESSLAAFEPRVELIDLFIDLNDEQNGYVVRITFRVLGNLQPATVTMFLDRIR